MIEPEDLEQLELDLCFLRVDPVMHRKAIYELEAKIAQLRKNLEEA